jgi:hypothetical protein
LIQTARWHFYILFEPGLLKEITTAIIFIVVLFESKSTYLISSPQKSAMGHILYLRLEKSPQQLAENVHTARLFDRLH